MQPFRSRPKLRLAPLGAAACLGFAALTAPTAGLLRAQTTDNGNRLDPVFHAPVLTLPTFTDKTFVLPDDRFYAYSGFGGLPLAFDRVAGEQRGGLVRFLADGSLDRSFRLDPTLEGYYVNAVAPLPDGRLIIAAARPFALIPSLSLFFYNEARFQVFRLFADGSRDPSFNAGSGTEPLVGDNEENGAAAFIRNVLVQPDGKILAGGQFRDFSGSGYSSLVRLNPDGSVDRGFARQTFRADVASGGQPTGIAAGNENLILQPDGKILVAGAFNELDGARRPGVARLNADGTLDASFVPAGYLLAPDDDRQFPIRAAALQADGKVLLGGPVANPADPTDRRPVVRLNADGSLDRLFDALLDETTGAPLGFYIAFSLRPLADGRVVFATSNGNVRLLNANGAAGSFVVRAADLAFTPDPATTSGPRLNLQSGGRLLFSGGFDAIGDASRPGGLARFLPTADGGYALDPAFAAPGPLENNIGVDRLTLRSDGGILIREFFTTVDGQPRATLALLNADGSLNAQVPDSPDLFNEPLFAIANNALVLPGDKTLLYGSTVDADFNFGFAYRRLNADGTPDATFQPDPSVPIFGRPLVQPDGKLLVSRGVNFQNEYLTDGFFSNNGAQALLDGNELGRLNADGTVDDSFTFGLDLTGLIRRDPETKAILSYPNGDNRALAVLPDGRILYKYFDGTNYNLVRLLPNGALDETFQTGTVPAPGVTPITGFGLPFINDPVTGESGPPLEDSQAATGYGFTSVLPLPDGRLIVAGDFTSFNGVLAGGLVRLTADGRLDATFRVGTGAAFTVPTVVTGQNTVVDDVCLEADGKLLLVGSFDTFNGVPRPGIARLNFDGSVDTGFVPPVTARATGGSFSLALNNSLQPLPDGGFLLAGNFAAPGDAPTAGPRSLFRLTPAASRTPVLTVAALVPQTAEGSPTPGVVIVARAGDLSGDLVVNYKVGGTAGNGTDYTMLTGARRMRPGVSTAKIKVRPVDDTIRDGAHNAKLTLLPGAGYTIGDQPAAKVKILDND